MIGWRDAVKLKGLANHRLTIPHGAHPACTRAKKGSSSSSLISCGLYSQSALPWFKRVHFPGVARSLKKGFT
jgi:hypothetical protein